MERSNKGGIKKAGDNFEVALAPEDTYEQCVEKALNCLAWEYDPLDGMPCLCRLNGCRVLAKDVCLAGKSLPWTISNYVNFIGAKPSNLKLGLALFQV